MSDKDYFNKTLNTLTVADYIKMGVQIVLFALFTGFFWAHIIPWVCKIAMLISGRA